MDKSYLLHNLKIVDNAEEDHGMLDLEFQNIRYEDRDLIADVIETARYVGEVNPGIFTTKHENVSLTGAGGGGGGGGDFTSATVSYNTNMNAITPFPIFATAGGHSYSTAADMSTNATFEVVLYKGLCVVPIEPSYAGANITTSGSAVYESGVILISGDCTITINESLT